MAVDAAPEKERAGRNRTLILTPEETDMYRRKLRYMTGPESLAGIENSTINQDLFDILEWLPRECADLLFIDPPYNLNKQFSSAQFKRRPLNEYIEWIERWLPRLLNTLKPTGSAYICADWESSTAIHLAASKYLQVRSRITWEREKGRGAKTNWKNCSEDIWYCTKSDNFTFNVNAVKMKRRVIAPYRDSDGKPKDWEEAEGGWRLTHPSNVWTDITIPFWSMPENTDHPTQKPEKLLAKAILASSNLGDLVLDPFLGSGTTSVAAKKLGRRYVGIEREETYSCMAEKRLALASQDRSIQGYSGGVFWERNSLQFAKDSARCSELASLFEEDDDE